MYSPLKNVIFCDTLRCFSLSAIINKSHYDSLGLTPKATQGEIKNAYYKLSMLYHPDKNKGSTEAANKFRDITSAYEILGNLRLRKLYDKGLLHTAGTEFGSYSATVEENNFYKSREQRSKPPAPSGKTHIYDFDEWTRNHYGETFTRNQRDKHQSERKSRVKLSFSHSFQSEVVIYSIISVVLVSLAFIGVKSDLDTPPVSKDKDKISEAPSTY